MTPKRSVGVTVTAVVSILGSAALLLFALLMLPAALVQRAQPGMPAYLGIIRLIEGLLFSGLAAWGITTAVGLFRLRGWARWSAIVFSGLLAMFCDSSALMIAIIQFPTSQGISPGLMAGIKVVAACFYAVLALLGAFWLYYFHTAGVRAQFGAGTEGPRGRPLSLWIIGFFLIMSGLFCLGAVFFSFPAMVFGLLLRGWTARLLFLVFAASQCWLGVELLRLRPLSRVLAIGFFACCVASTLLSVLRPGFPERVRAMMDAMSPGWPRATDSQSAALSSVHPMMLMGALVSVVPIWFLVARRGTFAKRPGSEQIGSQEPL
jgi:hypothetical protein